jgi:hypothetical protein
MKENGRIMASILVDHTQDGVFFDRKKYRNSQNKPHLTQYTEHTADDIHCYVGDLSRIG